METKFALRWVLVILFVFTFALHGGIASAWQVRSFQKIDSQTGGFGGPLSNYSHFGQALAPLGDLDGDGILDLAVGAAWEDDGQPSAGAVWILFMNADGTVRAEQKISTTAGGFAGTLDQHDFFGGAVANLGDLDGDGVVDLAVGAFQDDDGGLDRGAVWILFLRTDGTVRANQKISHGTGGLTDPLVDYGRFGGALAPLGDFDGDGIEDVVVGSKQGNAVYLLFLLTDGTVKAHLKIASGEGGFPDILSGAAYFGAAVCVLGDLDGNGILDLAVGARGGDWGGEFFILYLAPGGTVQSYAKLNGSTPGFAGELGGSDEFGYSLACLVDATGRGYSVLAVGARGDDDGGANHGAVYILHLEANGDLYTYQKISETRGGFGGTLADHDTFGGSIASLGDLDGDGRNDMAVGAYLDDTGCVVLGCDKGAVWILFTNRFDRAAAEFRNGSGMNAPCYTNTGLPIIGADWTADIDTVGHPGAFLCYALCYGSGASGLSTAFGEVLVDLGSGLNYTAAAVATGPVAHIVEAIPSDMSLVGISLATQALITGNGIELCNALDIVIGH